VCEGGDFGVVVGLLLLPAIRAKESGERNEGEEV